MSTGSLLPGFSLLLLAAFLGSQPGRGEVTQSTAADDAGPKNALAKYAKTDTEAKKTESFSDLKAKAEGGDAEAQVEVGRAYVEGDGIAPDFAEATRWFRKAAEQGSAEGQNFLGFAYAEGWGVASDNAEAIKWFRKSAEQGFPAAQLFLGLGYQKGKGVKKDYVEAARWLRKAADQGNAAAQIFLGVAYFEGEGLKKDYATAASWFRKSAEQGNALAEYHLGVCYNEGKGLNRDPAEAIKWFRKSAEHGYPPGRAFIARAYLEGTGVTRDYVEAYKWFDLAVAQGDSKAVSDRDKLARRMTPKELAEAGAVSSRGLTKFDRRIIDAHKQRDTMSCIPSSVEMVLKLVGRVPGSYYDLQTAWKNKTDGSFHDFDGKTFAGLTFHQQFTMARDSAFPLAKLFETIDLELRAGRFVIVGLAAGSNFHNWVIYDEDADGEFLAVSKAGARTIEQHRVKKAITEMRGTDIGTYEMTP